ncbi:Ig-like domain-containing protein [Caulobacter sp. 73W]|uniref:Ig-like domain-containing protein n=1 Tax=Caulobacter sp. 73W TaxID=3161137 RepID=A0AB39KYP5_9CAUL
MAALATTVTTLTFNADRGISNVDRITSVAAQTISGTISPALVGDERVQLSFDNGANWAPTTGGPTSFSTTATLAGGSHAILARVVNGVGEEGPIESFAYTLDGVIPAIAGTIVPPAGKTYGVGETLSFTVTFDDNVYFAGNDSTLELTIGVAPRTATFAGTAGRSITYSYVVQPGDLDTDGIAIRGLSLGSSTIQDRAGNNADLSLAGHLPSLAGVRVDAIAPAVSGNIAVPPNDTYRAGEILYFTVTFNDNVVITGNDSTLGLDIGGMARSAAYHSKTANSIIYAYTVQAGDSDANGITIDAISLGGTTIRDAVGNNAVLSLTGHLPSTAGVLIDTTAPVVSGNVSVPANATYVAGQQLNFTVTFDENVNVTGNDSVLWLVVGQDPRAATFVDALGNTIRYSYTVRPGDLDADGIALGGAITLNTTTIRDAAGNDANLSLVGHAPSLASVRIDGKAPGVASVSAPVEGRYSQGALLLFTVTFDENITASNSASTLGLDINGASVSAVFAGSTANSISYRYSVQAGQEDLDGIEITGISLNGSTIQDAAGNNANLSLTGRLPSLSGLIIDAKPPTVNISSSASQLKQGQTATITFTFSEEPIGFQASDLEVAGGTLSALSGSGTVYTATFTPTDGLNAGRAAIWIAAGRFFDAAGNASLADSSPAIDYDTRAPSAPTLALAAGADTGLQGDGVTANNRPTFVGVAESGSTVTLYDGQDNVIGSGTAVDGAFAIAPVVALGQGSHTISARAVDPAGNESSVSSGLAVTIDYTPPNLVITSSVDRLKIDETATITFTFDEPVEGFTLADIGVIGGQLSDFTAQAGGRIFTAQFRPTADLNASTAQITVGAGSYIDVAGNNGGSGHTPALTFDTRAPDAPAAPNLDAASDTGPSNSDNITSDRTPTFVGSAEAGATVTLYSGADVIGTAVATNGAWSIVSDTLDPGVHQISVAITDAFGNEGPRGPALDVEIRANSAPTGSVIITGSPTVGQKLEAASTVADADGLGTITYQWRAGGVDLIGETGASLIITPDHLGKAISVVARYVDDYGSPEAVSSADTAAVTTPAPPTTEEPPVQPPAPEFTPGEIRDAFAAAAGLQPNSPKATAPTITLADGSVVANPAYETAMKLAGLIARFEAGLITRDGLIDGVVDLSAPTSGVALSAYQFFTGSTPSAAGMAWLIDSPANANDLTDAYYARFNEVNRFINFAVSLGMEGEGRVAFAAKFGALDFQASVRAAYDMVIGLDAARAAGINVDAALAWIASQEGYFDAFAGSDLGGKAAMIGYLMQAGFEAKVGRYYDASRGFVEDTFDGTPAYQVDLVGGQHLG